MSKKKYFTVEEKNVALRENRRRASKLYRLRHPDIVKKYWKEYSIRNRELIRLKDKEYRKSKQGSLAIKEAAREYRKNHKDICTRATLAWRKKNKERVRENNQRYFLSPRGKQKRNERCKAWRINNKEKAKSGRLLRYYVSKGLIIRPTICSKCNKEDKIEAHHKDYSKPFEVIWLCRSCHMDTHWVCRK